MTDRETGIDIQHDHGSQVMVGAGMHPDSLLRSQVFVMLGGAAVQPFVEATNKPSRTDGMAMAELREVSSDKDTLLVLGGTKDNIRHVQNVLYMPVLPNEPFIALRIVGGANVAIPSVRPNLKARPISTVGPRSCGQAIVEPVACTLGPGPNSYAGQIFDFQNGTDFTLTSEDSVVLIWDQAANAYIGLTGKCC